MPGSNGQSITCLTADPGVTSLISAHSYTFVEIDHESLVELAQEKSVVRFTDCPDMTIAADWDIKHQTK